MASLLRSLRCFAMRVDQVRPAIHRLPVAGNSLHAGNHAVKRDLVRPLAGNSLHAGNHAVQIKGDFVRPAGNHAVQIPLLVAGNHAVPIPLLVAGNHAVGDLVRPLLLAGNSLHAVHIERFLARDALGTSGRLSVQIHQDGETLHASHQGTGGDLEQATQKVVRSITFRRPCPISFGCRGYATSSRNLFNPEASTEAERRDIRNFYRMKGTRHKLGFDYIHADSMLSQVNYRTPGSVIEERLEQLSKITPNDWLRPRNTVSCSLDGDVLENYVNSLVHVKLYHGVYGDELDLQVLCGIPLMMYTTPPSGTFHYILKKQSDSLNFIIDARLGWLYGVACPMGLFIFSKEGMPYITHTATRVLPFTGSYRYIAPYGIANLQVGASALIRAFDLLVEYDGSADSLALREAFGTVVLHICEGYKMHRVFALACEAMSRGVSISIGDCWDPQVQGLPQRFGKYGELAAKYVVDAGCKGIFDTVLPRRLQENIAGIDSFLKLGQNIQILPYKAVRLSGRLPRSHFTMCPVDTGFGDPEVSLLSKLNPSNFSEDDWQKIQDQNNFFFGDRAGGLPHPSVPDFVCWPPSDAWIGRLPFNIGQKIPPVGRQEPNRFWDRSFYRK